MLIDNILFLRERYPAIRAYFSEHEKDLDSEKVEIFDARAGMETVRFKAQDEQPLMVHSMYDPIREAERIIASHKDKIDEKTHVFFYGVGLGYHIEKFIEQFPGHSFSLYEPSPEVFLAMTKVRELKNIINKNCKHLYIEKHDSETLDYLNEFRTRNHNIQVIELPSYKNIFKEKHKQFHKNAKEAVVNRRTNLRTDVSFQKLWVMNSLINFKTVLDTPNMLKDVDRMQFEGNPALIVAAGPSLAEDIEHIRYIKEHNLAHIFSVGSAINSLIEYDVLPDAVFTYDPGFNNHKVFEKMIAHEIDDIPMVFGSSVGYKTLENYNGPKVHFITSQDRTSLYFLKEQLYLNQDLILDSPSIAVMTFQILNKLGAGPIVFAGQNLGYLYDRLYSEGIEYEHIQSTMDKEKLEKAPTTKDVYGNEIKTSVGFNRMRQSIEAFAKQYKERIFINTTKGGASIEGVPFQPIEEVIEETLTQPVDKKIWWNNANNYDQQDIDLNMQHLNREIESFTTILSSFEKLLEFMSINTRIRNETKLQNDLTRFDKLYRELNSNKYYNDFLSFYIRTPVKLLANELKRLNVEPDVLVKGKEIVPLLSQFIGQCKQGSFELEQIVTSNMKVINR